MKKILLKIFAKKFPFDFTCVINPFITHVVDIFFSSLDCFNAVCV